MPFEVDARLRLSLPPLTLIVPVIISSTHEPHPRSTAHAEARAVGASREFACSAKTSGRCSAGQRGPDGWWARGRRRVSLSVVELVGGVDGVLVLMERYWTPREVSGTDESRFDGHLLGSHSGGWRVCCRASGLRMHRDHSLLGTRGGETHRGSGGHGSRKVVRTPSDNAFPPWTCLLRSEIVIEGGSGEV